MRILSYTLLVCGISCTYLYGGIVTNGGFDTGDLTGWTPYTTSNGTAGNCGASPCPVVTMFNTTGSGSSSAAEFNVGLVSGPVGTGDYEGAGLSQSITLPAGPVNFSLDWAVENTSATSNVDGGTFEILLNGTTVGSNGVGPIAGNTTARGSVLATTTIATPGAYTLSVQVVRDFGASATTFQYMDNITASTVPEPSELAMVGIAIAGLVVRRRLSERRA